jgi:hypothetical protein
VGQVKRNLQEEKGNKKKSLEWSELHSHQCDGAGQRVTIKSLSNFSMDNRARPGRCESYDPLRGREPHLDMSNLLGNRSSLISA